MPKRLFTNRLAAASRLWNGVFPCPAPRLASRQSFQSQPASTREAMRLHGFQKIRRARRRKSTARAGTAEQTKKRRERALINANEKTNQTEHQSARIKARFARRNHSSSRAP